MSEAWTEWQGQLIDGKFHLQKYLGGSGQTAVFLVEVRSEGGSAAAYSRDPRWRGASARPFVLKVIADPADPELQLSRWRLAQTFSHPHLLPIFDTGRCRLGQIDLIFALMEYAEENLAQVISERPLNVDEARAMLAPALDALAWLHGQGVVHGHLKPANIMAANDVLKLSTDGVAPSEEAVPVEEAEGTSSLPAKSASQQSGTSGVELGRSARTIYQAPETAGGSRLPASDVWSLGVTMAEILTQSLPSCANSSIGNGNAELPDPLLPQNLPAEFVEIVRGCLRRELKLRWTIATIRARLNAPAAKPVARVEQPVKAQAAAATGSTQSRVATLIAQPAVHIHEVEPKAVQKRDPGAEASSPARALAKTAAEGGHAPEIAKKASPDRPSPRSEKAAPNMFEELLPLVRRFALPAIIVIAALGALYAALGLLRREKPRQTVAQPVIVKAEPKLNSGKNGHPQRHTGKERTSRKPSPVQSSESSAGQTTPPLSQQSSSAIPVVRSVSDSGVRHIDDGAVEDGEPPTVEHNASTTTSKPGPDASRNTRVAPGDSTVGVVQKVLPSASPSALRTIHGTVRVSVRVNVDRSGNVSRAEFASSGPSRYFARLSLQAAQSWKFSPGAGSLVLLHFEFTRSGARAFATRAGS